MEGISDNDFVDRLEDIWKKIKVWKRTKDEKKKEEIGKEIKKFEKQLETYLKKDNRENFI